MLRIRFLNVGQGDSIILEWQDFTDLSWKIGIIDCNIYNNENPTINYITQAAYSQIEFILLSHPHSDHFSGMKQLFLHCEQHNIAIKKFYHTSGEVPEYLKAACTSITDTNELIELYQTIFRMFKAGKISKQTLNSFSRPIVLTANIEIEILSPSEKEKDIFISNQKYYYSEENESNHPKINILSTVLKVLFKESQTYLLLTADTDKSTFKRIGINYHKENSQDLKGKLLLAQVPHHGAKANHYKSFWQNIVRDKGTFVVFSVGKNHYGHPDSGVRNDFINLNYQLRYTQNLLVNSKLNDTLNEIRTSLNAFSVPIEEGQDKVFYLENGNNIMEIST